ncbi:MAG: hypothetical protein ACKO40_00155, partial [Planctomycetaceae bacterium]
CRRRTSVHISIAAHTPLASLSERHIAASPRLSAPASLHGCALHFSTGGTTRRALHFSTGVHNTPCDKILAWRQDPYGDWITPTLFVAAGADLPAAGALRRDELSACLKDTQPFQMLAAGDTAGLGKLDDDGIRETLRSEKPTSISDLAGILPTESLSTERIDQGAVYEEDKMLDLRSVLGISLTDARRSRQPRTLGWH